MSVTTERSIREDTLEELRLSLQAMLRAHGRLRSRDSRDSSGSGFAHLRLLAELRRHGSLTASALAAAAELSPATVTEMLDTLVDRGLVERQRDERDRRLVHVRLTSRGRRVYDAKQARLREAWARELADLEPEAVAAAALVVARLATFFDRL